MEVSRACGISPPSYGCTAGRRCSAGARSCWPPPAASRSRSDDRRTGTDVRLPRPRRAPEPSGHPDRSGHCGYYGYYERDVQREVTELEGRSTTAARLFDIRRIISGLFVVYGVIVTLAGITASDA